jgi:transketolase
MALEDLASLRAVAGSVVLYPSDGNATAKLLLQMADHDGIAYMRTTRGATPVYSSPDEDFRIGGSRVLRQSDDDDLTIVTAGITLPEAVAAADALQEDGITARIIDLYSVKPVDEETLKAAAEATGRILTVEDHWPEGGIGDAVLSVFGDADERPRIHKLAVQELPGSGKPEELLKAAGIDAEGIAGAARTLVGQAVGAR